MNGKQGDLLLSGKQFKKLLLAIFILNQRKLEACSNLPIIMLTES